MATHAESTDHVPIVDVGCCPSKKNTRETQLELHKQRKVIEDLRVKEAQQKAEIEKQKVLYEQQEKSAREMAEEKLKQAEQKEESLKQETERLKKDLTEMKMAMKEVKEKVEAELKERLEAELGKDAYQKIADVVAGVARKTVGKIL